MTPSRLTRRNLLLGAAATSLLAPGFARSMQLSGTGAAGCWPQLPPPEAPRIDDWIEQLGRERNDPYSWMKFVPEQGVRSEDNLPAMIRDHLQEEAAYAEAVLEPLQERQDYFVDAMFARSGAGNATPPLRQGKWYYYSYLPEDALYPVHIRKGPDGVEEVLVDEAARAEGHAYYRATNFQASTDHVYYAWAEDLVGNDRHRICVLDTRDGTVRVLVAEDAYGYGGLTFSPSSRYLFWIWRDEHNRPTRLYRSAVTGDDEALIYEEKDPAIFMQVSRTSADGFVMLELSGPDTAEVRLIPRDAETAPPRIVRPRETGTTYEVYEWGGGLLMLTDEGGALDRKIVRLDPQTFETGSTLVAHKAGRPIVSLVPFSEALVRLERADGLHRLVVMDRNGQEREIAFDDPAYAISLRSRQDYDAEVVRVGYQTPATPMRWYDIDLGSGKRELVSETRLGEFNPADYEVERLEATAEDGVAVPITILSRRGTPKDGSAPLLLYGYGAYGASSDPVFSLPATVLVDAGWRYAIAHVRGGSEKGRQWFLDGRRFKKKNSMTDFIACARHLADAGYTAPKRIAAYGLSAGGLLVGGAMNIAPELWGAVIAKVPFVDMLNTMSDADHPLVPLFRPDWGDPLANPKAYDYIASISPYENVHSAAYPPLLCTAGLKDDRVSYWEPAKFVAQIRHETTSANPAVLLVDPDAGHQGSGDLRSEYSQMALFWAFAERSLMTCDP